MLANAAAGGLLGVILSFWGSQDSRAGSSDEISGSRYVVALLSLVVAAVVLPWASITGPQWLALRRHLPRARWWPWATGLGFLLSSAYLALLVSGGGPVSPIIILGPALAGVVQTWVLWTGLGERRWRAACWPAASTAGVAVASAILWGLFQVPLDRLGQGLRVLLFVLELVAFGALYGAITSPVLVWLLRERIPASAPVLAGKSRPGP